MKYAYVIIVIALCLFAYDRANGQNDDIVCVWPDGSVTMPNHYTKTCPSGSVPMRR